MNWIKFDHCPPFESGSYLVAIKDGTYVTAFYSLRHKLFAIPFEGLSEDDIVAWCDIEPCEFIPDIRETFVEQVDKIIDMAGKDGVKL
jgi:hypothetical protein